MSVEQTATLALPARMDASTLPQTHAELLSRRGADLDLDASAVDRFGAQALQLVLSAFTTWAEDGFRLRVSDPSETVRASFDQLGCAEQLNVALEDAA